MSVPCLRPLPALPEQEPLLVLAPMDGVTDFVHRDFATRLGGVSACVSEFVRVTDGAVAERVFLRQVPELASGGRTAAGVPVFVQLLGGDPRAMAASARVAERLGASGIDLNFGCPAKRVNSHDGGASILRCPPRTEEITRAVRDAVAPELAVTAKIRLGWADAEGVVELARHVERAGASWLTIHGRTKQQMYAPPVDMDAIGRAARAVAIPVLANGDIVDHASFEDARQRSQAAGFMIGRGALAHPRLFLELRGQVVPPAAPSLPSLAAAYVERLVAHGRSDEQALRRLKQWLGLARTVATWAEPLFDRVKVCASLAQALSSLEADGQRAA